MRRQKKHTVIIDVWTFLKFFFVRIFGIKNKTWSRKFKKIFGTLKNIRETNVLKEIIFFKLLVKYSLFYFPKFHKNSLKIEWDKTKNLQKFWVLQWMLSIYNLLIQISSIFIRFEEYFLNFYHILFFCA